MIVFLEPPSFSLPGIGKAAPWLVLLLKRVLEGITLHEENLCFEPFCRKKGGGKNRLGPCHPGAAFLLLTRVSYRIFLKRS